MIRATLHASAAVLAVLLGLAAGATQSARAETLPAPTLPDAGPLTSIPTGKGLPVAIRAGLSVNRIDAFDDNLGTFAATTDLRLTWFDIRLRYPAEEGLHGYKEYRRHAPAIGQALHYQHSTVTRRARILMDVHPRLRAAVDRSRNHSFHPAPRVDNLHSNDV